MSESNNQLERDDIKCVSNGKRMFLKLSGIALAALALDSVTMRSVLANNNGYLHLPMTPQTGAVDLGSGDVGIMNYAYALEQGELAFLKRVLANPFGGITADERRVFQDLHDHEVVHNEFFKAVLGARAIPQLRTDFSKVNFNNRKSVLETSMTFADLATSAYNGAGKLLSDPANLEIAGKIVSVEARHAAVIRDLIKPRSGFFAPEALDPAREPDEVLKIASAFVKTPLDASRLPRKSGGKP